MPAWLRILVAGWPALAFLGGTLLVHAPVTATAPERQETAAPAPVDLECSPEPEPEREAVETPEPAPALPAASPASPPVPAALVQHARKVAAAHQAQTGRPIDTDTLRARLGVPAFLADAIAAQLA